MIETPNPSILACVQWLLARLKYPDRHRPWYERNDKFVMMLKPSVIMPQTNRFDTTLNMGACASSTIETSNRSGEIVQPHGHSLRELRRA